MAAAGIDEILPQAVEGDRPSASAWNTMAAVVMRGNKFNRGHMRTLSNGAGNFTIPEEDSLLIRNLGDNTATPMTMPSYGIGLAYNRFANDIMGVIRPDRYGCQLNFFFAGGSAISLSEDGDAQPWENGWFIGRLNPAETSPSLGDTVGPKSGDYFLHLYGGGFQYVGNYDDGSGDPLIFVIPQPMYSFYGQNTGSRITKGNTGTITVLNGGAGSPTVTGVEARFGDVPANAKVQCDIDFQQSNLTSKQHWFVEQTDLCP